MSIEERVPTPAPWAAAVGYSRAVRAGNLIFVAGTAATADQGGIAFPGDPYRQTLRCLEIIEDALRQLGAERENVVRTRMFVRYPEHWQEVGRAHGEYFAATRPASTMVVTGFIDDAMLVEIEADAVL